MIFRVISSFRNDYIINRTVHDGLKIWILSSRGENNILTLSPRSFVKYLYHLKIKLTAV